MSFKCEMCNEVQKRPVKFISKKREKIYPNTAKKGWEIIEEEYLCRNCADKKAESPQVLIEVKPQQTIKRYLVSEPKRRKIKDIADKKKPIIREEERA